MAPKFCHITPILVELRWLPVRWRIDYKILLITFKAINGLAPLYLSDLVSIKSSTYSLRSNDSKSLSAPPVKGKKALGDRSFMLAAPKLWNELPRDLRLVDNISSFKKQLKTHLFKLAYSLIIPVVFHTLQDYDSHLLLQEMSKLEGKIFCIPNNTVVH